MRILSPRSRRDGERGQAAVFLVAAMVCLLGMAAITIDVGYAFLAKRRAQAAADASALAAAKDLPNTSLAASTSSSYAAKNFSMGTVTLTFSNTLAANDTADTSASATVPSFFANLFGFTSFTAAATASAAHEAYTGWAINVAPWVTDKASIRFGQNVNFKVAPGNKAAPGNFGAVDLPLKELGCGYGNGSSDYVNTINNGEHSCLVKKGDSLPVEPGNMGGNTGKALKDRGATNNFNPYSILQQLSNGSYELTSYTHPNLVVIPVIAAFHNGSSAPFSVTGLAWFIVTSYSGDTVTGMFVRSEAQSAAICPTASNPNNACPIGPYDPDGITVVQFTK